MQPRIRMARLIQLVDGRLDGGHGHRVVANDHQRRLGDLVQTQHVRGLADGGRIDDDVLIMRDHLFEELEQGAVQVDRVALQHGGQQIQIPRQGHHRILYGGLPFIQRVQGAVVVPPSGGTSRPGWDCAG